ncbi:uncharacterized protein [Dendropsophus ebraccatus]|uniref:uncharacterized protein n=1 Tax=Dendropsophus ebraccatus TaxID=150705 RepID=UPI003831D043
MAAVRALLLLGLCHTFLTSAGSALEIYAPPTRKAEVGTNVTIPCKFKVDGNKPINLQYLAIVWEFQGSAILRYDNKGIGKAPRRYIEEKNIAEGTADLYINEASVSDVGTYRCTVIYSPDTSQREVYLTVYARPSISALETVKLSNDQTKILCSVTGYYPEQITVELIKDGAVVSGSVRSSPHMNEDKTFSINSSAILPSTDRPKSLSCRVHHESITASVQQNIRLQYNEDGGDSTGLVVGVIAGVILILLLVIAVVLYKKRSGTSEILVSKIHGAKMMSGESVTLYCTACNCPEKTQVIWTIKGKDGTTCEIAEKTSGDREEEQPLMSMEYKVSSEKVASQKRKSLQDIKTNLTFIPSVSRHLGSTVTCKFITDQKSEEETQELKDIYAKPQFREPIQFTITSQGDVRLSATVERFHPKPLQISWASKRGHSQENIPSEEEEVLKNPDGTYNLTSKCTVSGDLFKDPTHKVTVTWKHESMDNSQSRDLSAKDLPWRPQIGDYIESVTQDDEIRYRCSVSDYFPDAVTVRWFEKKKDFPDLIEISESETYKVLQIILNRTDKKTFAATSYLSMKKSLLTKKEVVIICRVDHPSLEKPIEAKTMTVQNRDTELQTFIVNNIQGPQTWYDGEKVVLYCAALYCTQNTRVIWTVTGKDGTEQEICEDSGGSGMRKDGGQHPGYVAHRERTDESDIPGLQDFTSCLSFTPSIANHKDITISCRVTCEGRGKQKTFQRKQLYAKPKVLNPIKLSLADSGDVLCALHIEEFYPSDIQIKWNDKEKPSADQPAKNTNGTYTVRSEYKLPGSFFKDPQSMVKVSWIHKSMDGWEWRQICAVDTDFSWRPELREIQVPNLLDGIPATLKCEVSNVFPDELNVRWMKKDAQGLFPLVHGDKYSISEITPERQKDNTYIYKACLRFTPSLTTDQETEFIFRAEHPSLGKPAEKSTGPLSIQEVQSSAPSPEKCETDSAPQTLQANSVPHNESNDLAETPQKNHQQLIVGDIRGRDQWTQGKKVTLQCPVSYCTEDVTVAWTVTDVDGNVQEVSSDAARPLKEREALKTSGYFLVNEMDESDVEGLFHVTSMMRFIPRVRKHYGCLITCTVISGGETKTQTFKPKSIHAKPQVLDPVEVTLTDSGDVRCALTLQNFYPKHITVRWTTEQNPLESNEDLQENADGTYNIRSLCPVQGSLLTDTDCKLSVIWSHRAMKGKETRVLSWRDQANSFPWRPFIQAVPVPHVLMGQVSTFQYNTSGYYPDAVTVHWYKKEKGAPGSASLHDDNKYKTLVTESQRQPDGTYSCTASLRFTPTLRDQESEIICLVEHPSLETPLEGSSGPLCVQGKPKNRKPVRVTAGNGEMIYSLILENFYPRDIQITWLCGSEQVTQTFPSTEEYITNMDKSYSVTSDCRVPENYLKDPNIRICVTWNHESMDDPGSREMSIRDKDYPYRPQVTIQVPPLYNNTEASLECIISNCFPDLLVGMWLRKDKLSGDIHHIAGDGAYRIYNTELGRQPNNTYLYKSCLVFTPTAESHQGAELIFQVEHSSLVQPMWKSTGDLQIYGKPENRKPVRVTAGNGEMIYSLILENFYPRDIQITWLCGSEQVTQTFPSTEQYITNMDKSYNVTSDCRFPENYLKDPNVRICVTWNHESMDDPGSREMSIRDQDYPYRPQMTIQVPPLYNNIEASLECIISNCFPDLLVGMWLRKDKLSGDTHHLAGDGAYMICNSELGRQPNNTYSYKSCLVFTPTVESHQGVEFIYQVEHPSLVQPMRKSTGDLQIYGKPENRKPVRVTAGNGEIIYSLILENFYPRDIQITWLCGSEQVTQTFPSTEEYTTNMDESYTVTSDCKVSENYLKDPNFRICVTWNHESMDHPERREMSIRDEDYPYRPQVAIQVPPLYNNTEASLECIISNCFPDLLVGMWLRKDKLYGDTHHIAGDGAYRIYNTELGRQPNNTYSYKSCLVFTPTVESHQGAEFISQVGHPSLVQPMRKSTGDLQIYDSGSQGVYKPSEMQNHL